MGHKRFRLTASTVLVATICLWGAQGLAADGDCGQPLSNGDKPTASDALFILRAAVGQEQCDPCPCDVSGDGSVSATDALIALQVAVGSDRDLLCDCGPEPFVPGCTSAEFFALGSSVLSSGYTGVGHNSNLIEGVAITIRVLRRCTDTDEVCEMDADCANNECEPTCDCIEDNECELTGPTHDRHCRDNLEPCDSDADCNTNVDCAHTFGPPLPLSAEGTPACIVTTFASDITGTANAADGTGVMSVALRSRVYLGLLDSKPCARCGDRSEDPQIGDDHFVCDGGPNDGLPCTVEAVSPDFGGVSHDCPMSLQANVSGNGLAIRFSEVSTGTVSKTAELPCGSFLFRQNNPDLNPATSKCTDNDDPCTSNADCMRCDNDLATVCTGNGDCSGGGECKAAPDIPVSCGFYCHCGFCDDDAEFPCFSDADCADGSTCEVGTGGTIAANAPQKAPNDCSASNNVCGLEDSEECNNNFAGECSDAPWISCFSDTTCEAESGGTCLVDNRPCFEHTITRTGTPSPLGSYCRADLDNASECSSHANCNGGDGECVEDSSRPTSAALFCVGGTSSSGINASAGITGPGAIKFDSFIRLCRCGDNDVGCDEQCDDGNRISGDDCDEHCQIE